MKPAARSPGSVCAGTRIFRPRFRPTCRSRRTRIPDGTGTMISPAWTGAQILFPRRLIHPSHLAPAPAERPPCITLASRCRPFGSAPPKSCITLHQPPRSHLPHAPAPQNHPSDAGLPVTQKTPNLTLCISFSPFSPPISSITRGTPKTLHHVASRPKSLHFQHSSAHHRPAARHQLVPASKLFPLKILHANHFPPKDSPQNHE